MILKPGKHGILVKKYLQEYKPFEFSHLVMDGTIMDYLLMFENHLKDYANLVEVELKQNVLLLLKKRVLLNQLSI